MCVCVFWGEVWVVRGVLVCLHTVEVVEKHPIQSVHHYFVGVELSWFSHNNSRLNYVENSGKMKNNRKVSP